MELVDLCKSLEGEIVNSVWLEDEITAIANIEGMARQFLDLYETQHLYSNDCNSSVAYFMGITDEAPTGYPETLVIYRRSSLPDIDLDVQDDRRHEMIEYVRDKYGHDRVAHIGTFTQVGAKTAIRDATRVLGLPFSFGDKISKMIPDPVLGVTKSIKESLESSKSMSNLYERSEEAKLVIDGGQALEGVYRAHGIHAAGVIISQGPVTDHVPVMQRPSADGEPGPVVTQWDMERVEQCGQLKIDFLGLRNMTVLDRCLAYIKERHGKDIDLYRDVPWDNRLTYKRLSEGDSIGTFQMESSGMKEMMMSLRPDSITDIMALIALYRPGPMGSGMDKLFIARKHGRKTGRREPHPILNELLPTTYGIMLYQEDVLKVAGEIAGFTPLERETLRKALGKKLVDKLAKMKKEFIAGAKQKGVVGPQEAAQIFEDIEYFGGYGFSASHAASYSLISYWTAYFKFNYTVEYMAALLTSVKNNKDKSTLYLNECRRLGIRVLPPSITESESEFRVISDDTILFGLGSINGIGHSIVEKLTGRDRKHIKTINQFLMSADKDIMKKDVMNHLVNSGAMDELIPEQQDRLLTTEDKHEVLKLEQESLGLYVIEHPLDGVWDHIKTKATHTIQQAINLGKSRQNVTVAGVITQSVRKVTKTGNVMYLLQVEDLESSIEVVVFGNHAKDYDFPVGTIGIISGTVDQDVFGETVTSKIMLNDFTQPDLPKYATGKAFVYRLDQMPHYESLETIASVASQFPGDCIIVFEFFDGDDKLVRLKLNQPVSESIEEKLGQLVKSVMSYV